MHNTILPLTRFGGQPPSSEDKNKFIETPIKYDTLIITKYTVS